MTMALCLYCGEIHFGALCACENCGSAVDQMDMNMVNLSIMFSDHNMSTETLEQFGHIFKTISRHCNDGEERFWTFLKYVSDKQPSLLALELPDSIRKRADSILGYLDLP
jgi:hypothetical protein